MERWGALAKPRQLTEKEARGGGAKPATFRKVDPPLTLLRPFFSLPSSSGSLFFLLTFTLNVRLAKG